MFPDDEKPPLWRTLLGLEEGQHSLGWRYLGLPNPHHRLDPRAILWRVHHRLTGPQRGCSCTRCFSHPKRRILWSEAQATSRRAYDLTMAVRRLRVTRMKAAAGTDKTVLVIREDSEEWQTLHDLAWRRG